MRNDAHDDFENVPTLRAAVSSRDTPVIKVKGPSTGPLWVLVCALLLAVAGLGWWSFQQISLMEQQLVATQESFARISEDAAGRLQAISGKVVASESSINNGSEALKLQIKQLEEQLLEQSKRQQGAVAGQQGDLEQRFEQINAAMLMQVTAQKDSQTTLETEQAKLETQVKELNAEVAQLKKQGNPSAAIERLEQDLIVLKSELENRPAPTQGASSAEFDVFRGQVTRNINTLQSQIQNLQKQISARP